MNDSDLIKKIADKDHRAFNRFVDIHLDKVLNICFHITNNREDAEDIAQEVFLQVYKSAGSFKGKSKVSTWLARIAINLSLNHIRNNKKFRLIKYLNYFRDNEKETEVILHALKEETPDVLLENKQIQSVYEQAIQFLPDNQKVAWTLHKSNNLPYKEIAVIMERSLSSVESLIHRAKINLQKKLLHYLKSK